MLIRRRPVYAWISLVSLACGLLSGELFAGAKSPDELARTLLERGGVERGVCAIFGSQVATEGESLPIALARASKLVVHVRDPRAAVVGRLQAQAEEAGFGIQRVIIEKGPANKLPYVENLADLIIVMNMTDDGWDTPPVAEIVRALRPDGVALLGPAHPSVGFTEASLAKKVGKAGRVESWTDSTGTWLQLTKSPLEGVDEWTHWERAPDNNPVSTDQVIKAPYMTQFLAEPFYIGMPSVTTAAGGRTFLAIGHIAHHKREWDTLYKLIARNGYNGTVLWTRKLPDGYLVHRSAFIATKDTFHMIDGNGCLLLDSRTGKEKGHIRIPGVTGEWKWMALKDGVLFVLAGKKGPGTQATKGDRIDGGWSWQDLSVGYYTKPRIPFGFGTTLAAYDVAEKRRLWLQKEENPVDSRAMAMVDDNVFLFAPQQHLRGLSAKTGDVLWTNSDAEVLGLIEEPGRDLTSTPGFRTACLTVATPKALIIQGQTRMNVVAVSTKDGSHLWTKKKVTNNPNAIYVDGNVILGVGPEGHHVVLDPESGDVLETLGFRKAACTRLTASPDSFFCRGEGTLRFDRRYKKALIDGAARPACTDGAMATNGLLYVGPWQCDCNLSLIGNIAKCSAGDFAFEHTATDAERLERGAGDLTRVTAFETSTGDWFTYRGNYRRSGSTTTPAPATLAAEPKWKFTADEAYVPTAPTASGGLVFVGGEDGKVRAFDLQSGELRWQYATSAPIKYAPTIWKGRAFFGSGDGYAYALEAATGRLLWRFRAAPLERRIMVYGRLTSTWPVYSGVLVHDGAAYFAAGIIDYDGTHVYAVDAITGELKWQNNTSGHLNKELRKGVSVQGNLSIQGNRLLMAGGNQVSPALFDLETGECLAQGFDQGKPKAHNGRFVGVFDEQTAIVGGRTLFSSPENVTNKGGFQFVLPEGILRMSYGGIPPAWDDDKVVVVNHKHGKLLCSDRATVATRIKKRELKGRHLADDLEAQNAVRWQSDLDQADKFEVLSLTVCPDAVVALLKYRKRDLARPWPFVAVLEANDGTPRILHPLRQDPLPGGLLVGRGGKIIVALLNGDVLCLGPGGE